MNISLSQLLEESFQIAWEYRNGRELVDLVGDELRLRDARQVAYDDVLRASNLLATMHRSLALPHAVVSCRALRTKSLATVAPQLLLGPSQRRIGVVRLAFLKNEIQ